MHACYQCALPFQNLRLNKLVNNLSCVHRRAEVLGECQRASHQYSGRLQWRWANGSHPCTILAKQFPWRLGVVPVWEPLSHRHLFFFVSNHSSKPPWGDAAVPLPLCILQSAFSKHQRDSPVYVLRTERQPSQSSLLPRLSPRPSGCSSWCVQSSFSFFFSPTLQPLRQRRTAAALL